MAIPGANAPSSGSQPALPSAREASRKPALALGAAACGIALVGLAGWATGHLTWAGAIGEYHPIVPITAIGVLLLGLALAVQVQRPNSSWAKVVVGTIAVLVALYALVVLLQAVTGFGGGLDRPFVPRRIDMQDSTSGRIAPAAATLFLSLGAALLLDLAGRERRLARDAATLLAGVALAGAAAINVGYLLGVPFFYTRGQVPPALPTALAFGLLALALLATRDRRSWIGTPKLVIALVVILGVAVSAASAAVVSALERARTQAAFVLQASTIATALERSMVENLDEVERLAAFCSAGPVVEPRAFRRSVAARFEAHPGLLLLGWAPRVADDQARAFVAAAQKAGEPSFSLHAPGGGPPPVGAVHWPLRYLEGPAASARLAGLDLAAVPPVWDALEAAERSGALAASAEVTLADSGLVEPAVWVAMPVVYRLGSESENGRDFAVGAFSLARIVAASLAGLEPPATSVRLVAAGTEDAANSKRSDAARAASDASHVREFNLAGRLFRIEVTPRAGAYGRPWVASGVLGGGLIVTMLLGLYLFRGARLGAETRRLLEVVRTSEKRATEALSLLEQTVAAVPVPVFLKGSDGAYQLCNAEMGRWLGRDPSELAGKYPEELYPPEQASKLQEMDDALIAEAGTRTLQTRFASQAGEARDVVVNKASVLDTRGAVRGVVGVMFDVTEQRKATALQTALFDLSEATHTATGLEELLPAVHRAVGRLMVARNLYVALFDPATGLLSFPYFADEVDEDAPAPRPPGRGITEYVLRTGRAALVPPQRFEELVAEGEVELIGAPSIDWLGVPLVIGGATRGVLAVQTYTEGERYTDRDRELLAVVGGTIAEAIDRTQGAAALRESEERFRALADSASDAILTSSSDGKISYANRAALAIFGYPDGMAGRAIETIIPERFRREHLAGFGRAAHGESSRPAGQALELVALRSDGSEFPVELSLASWRAQGKVYFTAIVRDISERQRLQQDLVRTQRMEAVGRLAGGVAHDLNNAMQSMLASIALLRAHGGDRATLDASLNTLDEEIRRAASTTRQLLLFSRREVTRLDLLDLAELVRESEPLLRPLLRDTARLLIEVQDTRLPIRADCGQLQQALMNLVANASDAMPDGGTVRVTAGTEGAATVFVEVADTGTGMSDEVRAHLFEPFFTTKGHERGTGLGLSVTQGIVSRHGGRLQVESGVGRGSRFRAVFPRDGDAPATAPPEVGAIGLGRRILLVEDEDGAREGLAAVLDLMGFATTAVASGEAVLELPDDRPFDVLLTDVVLPGMGGGEVARRLSARWPQLKVVLMSGHAEDVLARQQIRLGEACFLQKPFTMDALARELAAALANPREPRSPSAKED